MRIVFMGTPEFSVLPLKKILEYKNAQVVGVVCNNDKKVGRKQILTPPPVKVFATEKGLPVFQFNKIRLEGVEIIKSLQPDLIITCAFGQILSQEIIDIPKFGVINIHASLLPKYRGASPVHYAILNGEKQTGITIMKTDIGIDTGDIIEQKALDIFDNETTGELFQRLSVLGADMIYGILPKIEKGSVNFVKQNEALASYSKMIKKEDALIDFSMSAERVVNQIRAFNPSPICYTFYNGEIIKIYSAVVLNEENEPYKIKITPKDFIVGCGEKSVKILEIQRQGGKVLKIGDFLRGFKLNGEYFSKC